jgi:hypothetical protein
MAEYRVDVDDGLDGGRVGKYVRLMFDASSGFDVSLLATGQCFFDQYGAGLSLVRQ